MQMSRMKKQFGSILAIASFAMMLGAHWLHSPLHHVVSAVQSHARRASQTELCPHSLASNSSVSDESGVCSHDHGAHTHRAAQQSAAQNADSLNIETSSGSEPCQHHHPDNDCRLCEFLAENVGVLQHPLELSIVEAVQTVPDSVQITVDSPVAYRQLVRGPPTFS